MNEIAKVAADMAGGDDTPGIVLGTAKRIIEDFKGLEIILLGDESQYGLSHERIEFRHCAERIEMEGESIRAIKRRKDSSVVRMTEAIKSGEVDGCILAGDTGTLVSAGLFIVGRIKGVAKPALVVTLSIIDDKGFILLDVGVDADTKAEHLLQYTQLGNVCAQKIRGIQNSSISLLNIGIEAARGNSLTKRAYDLFEKSQLLNFTGSIEIKTLVDGNVDVVVTDGYTGNTVLKNLESTTKSMDKILKEIIISNPKSKLAGVVLKKDLETFAEKMDYSKYGGLVLLGSNGTVVKAHGGSNAKVFYSVTRQAKVAGEENIVQIMKDIVGE